MFKPKRTEIKTLYRTFAPVMKFYEHDGEGRDMYIGFNNGGFLDKKVPQGTSFFTSSVPSTRYRFRWPAKEAVAFTYRSDGTGRDGYIMVDSGGLNKSYKPLRQYQLNTFLRSPSCDMFEYNTPTLKRSGSQGYISRDEYKINQILLQNQRGVIDRLYNRERYKFIPGM